MAWSKNHVKTNAKMIEELSKQLKELQSKRADEYDFEDELVVHM